MREAEATPRRLQERFPDAIVDTLSFRGEETVVVKKEAILPIWTQPLATT